MMKEPVCSSFWIMPKGESEGNPRGQASAGVRAHVDLLSPFSIFLSLIFPLVIAFGFVFPKTPKLALLVLTKY